MSISENFGIHIFSGFSAVPTDNCGKIHVRIILGHPIPSTFNQSSKAYHLQPQTTTYDLPPVSAQYLLIIVEKYMFG